MVENNVLLKDSEFFKTCRDLGIGEDEYIFVDRDAMAAWQSNVDKERNRRFPEVERYRPGYSHILFIGVNPEGFVGSWLHAEIDMGQSDFPIDEVYEDRGKGDPEMYILSSITHDLKDAARHLHISMPIPKSDAAYSSKVVAQYIYLLFGDYKRVTILFGTGDEYPTLYGIWKE